MIASDVMTKGQVWACAETADARSCAGMMKEHDVGCIPVLDKDGKLEGIVTDRDLCIRILAQGKSFETPVREIMSTNIHCAHSDTSIEEIESLMTEYQIRRLPVVDDDNRLQGFISFSDLALHCHSSTQEHELMNVFENIVEP